jgi:hypothetical protein
MAGSWNESDAQDRACMPVLFVIQFLTWIGMFMIWIFALPLVAVALCMAPLTDQLSPAPAIAAGGAAMGVAGLLMLSLSFFSSKATD